MGGSTTFSEVAPPTLEVGVDLGKYRIVRLLGAGGMGAVYEATHREIGKHVAIKVLSPTVAAIPGARARFLREAQLTSRVYHPNIVNVTDTGNEGDRTYLVMELFRGEDLAQRIARQGRLAAREAVDILLPVCSAVMAAHEAGVTHRDLKPSNVFLSDSGHGMEPKVLDFGISKSMDAGLGPEASTGTGTIVGTPFYLAPEQVMDNRSAGPASDQYALGVILYECLTGVRPYQHESLYVVFKDIVAGAALPPRSHCPDIPGELEQIVLRAMHVDAASRYPSIKELGWELLTFASQRVLSIWQDAFRSEAQLVPDFISTPAPDARSGRAVAETRIMTPSVGAVPQGRGGPVGLAGGTQIAAPLSGAALRALKPAGRSSRAPVTDDGAGSFDDTPVPAIDFPESPSRGWWPVAIVAALLACGLAGWLIWGGQAADDELASSTLESKKKLRGKRSLNLSDTAPLAASDSPGAAPPNPSPEAGTFPLSLVVEPETALIELDGRLAGRGRLERRFPKDHTLHRLRITAEGYAPELVEFSDTPPPKNIALTALPSSTTDSSGRTRSRTGTGTAPDPDRSSFTRPKRPRRGGDAPPSADPPGPGRSYNPNSAPIID